MFSCDSYLWHFRDHILPLISDPKISDDQKLKQFTHEYNHLKSELAIAYRLDDLDSIDSISNWMSMASRQISHYQWLVDKQHKSI